MWTKIFQEYVSDQVALVVHVYLLSGDVLATWAVAAGIIWESTFDIRHIAHRLVIWGVAVETVCSLALFTFDEGISAAQQATIGAQQSKIIALENELRPRSLTPEAEFRISEKLKKFSGTSFAVTTLFDSEPANLLEQVTAALKKSGWIQDDWNVAPNVTWPNGHKVGTALEVGISVEVAPADEQQLLPRAKALVAALVAEGIDARIKNPPKIVTLMPGAVNIFIGSKPTDLMKSLLAE